jgi:hypothetical protein
MILCFCFIVMLFWDWLPMGHLGNTPVFARVTFKSNVSRSESPVWCIRAVRPFSG